MEITYMIHICPEREWYVDNYLIPSMEKQGIARENIIKFVDNGRRGNLTAFLDSLEYIKSYPINSGIWHLQDDVIISSTFKEVTERNNIGIVQGFCSQYDDDEKYWFSFQCFRVPNYTARDFMLWTISNKKRFKDIFEANKYDDSLFREYLREKGIDATRLYPNIVDHVDWLIGGSIINKDRKEIIRAKYWQEDYLVSELARELRYIN